MTREIISRMNKVIWLNILPCSNGKRAAVARLSQDRGGTGSRNHGSSGPRRRVLGQESEAEIAPDGSGSVLHGSSRPAVCECLCEWVNERLW